MKIDYRLAENLRAHLFYFQSRLVCSGDVMYNFVKRIMDIFISVIVLALTLPISFIAALAIIIRMGCPVFFRQKRPGYKEKPFILFKFRTMNNEFDSEGNQMPDSLRLTTLGKFLRKTSIDELPQLWNVLKGEMSLVGPRPLFMEYLTFYTEREKIRHDVKPGITGLAQVSGRNRLLWDERLELDVQYVEMQSLSLDLVILYKTFINVLMRKDLIETPGTVIKPLSCCREKDREYHL